MQKFESISSRALVIDRANIDTDIILPAKYLKTVTRSGLGVGAFEAIRAEAKSPFDGFEENPASILIAGSNFGCGSSREHAVWAILDLGVRVVIAPGFSDIFAGNASKNGLLTISLDEDIVGALMIIALDDQLMVSLDLCTISFTNNPAIVEFEIDSISRRNLLMGLDEISQTLEAESEIAEFEETRQTAVML